MLNEQSNLNGPFDPNPFHDPELENIVNAAEYDIHHEHDANGILRKVPRRKSYLSKFKVTILNRGYVPLVLRFISWFFAFAALFLCGFITRYSMIGGVETRPSTVMAFVVNGVAVFYLPWVAKVSIF